MNVGVSGVSHPSGFRSNKSEEVVFFLIKSNEAVEKTLDTSDEWNDEEVSVENVKAV